MKETKFAREHRISQEKKMKKWAHVKWTKEERMDYIRKNQWGKCNNCGKKQLVYDLKYDKEMFEDFAENMNH
ncbi:MAG: hypothetical protein ACTSWK_07245, partial [Promethearchaeota archaeon]